MAAYHRYEARKRGLVSDMTASQWRSTLEYFGYSCVYCGGQPKQLIQEHFIPVTSKGGYTISNIVPACARCNNSKRAASAKDWVQSVDYVLPNALERIERYFESVKEIDNGAKN